MKLSVSEQNMRTLQSEVRKFVNRKTEEIKANPATRREDLEVIEAAEKLDDVLSVISARSDLFKPFDRFRIKRDLLAMIEFLRASIPDPTEPGSIASV